MGFGVAGITSGGPWGALDSDSCQIGTMRLDGFNGTSVKLMIDGYQFPGAVPAHARDWDANWLVITGEVSATHGHDWRFHGCSLTTWEVDELTAWLRSVSRCEVPAADEVPPSAYVVSDWPGHATDAGWLTFTEPSLSFAVGGYYGLMVHLLVGLGHESAPPAVDTDRPSWCRVTVVMAALQVQDAGDALQAELAAYPAR